MFIDRKRKIRADIRLTGRQIPEFVRVTTSRREHALLIELKH